MAINALSYLGVHSEKLEDWQDFSCKLLGMQNVDRGKKTLSFRMDNQKQRLAISGEAGDTLAFIGWEVENKSDLDEYARKLNNANYNVNLGSKNLCDKRFVEDLIFFNDPSGNRIELVFKPLIDKDPFIPGRPISGFKTGVCGLGHAVLFANNMQDLLFFYRDLLDFKVSDYSIDPIPLYFFHVNGRHHSFALVGSEKIGFHHFMVEYKNLDDVGQGFDLVQDKENAVAYTIGRHTNDYMTSFYANSPSGFFVENGWGGRVINPETWEAHETNEGPSFWGHERLYMPEDQRKIFRDKRLENSALGKQAPLLIDCPWLYEITKK
jgi:2,3-dihydroxybiphenyl 1,2-dioxygenase|tara:strand:+ start:999 stop:1967 length:969 start_codon:yes stop_codon:yes gene_type:complete